MEIKISMSTEKIKNPDYTKDDNPLLVNFKPIPEFINRNHFEISGFVNSDIINVSDISDIIRMKFQ